MTGDLFPRDYGKTFDEVAAEYDRSRPTYPDELVDAACALAGSQRGDRVLEIGCGSGQLTQSLVARSLQVTALDPGKHLMELAAQKLEDLGRIEFVRERFEEASLPQASFKAIFSAAAFHWTDPEVSWRKAASLLVPGGTLVLIQYCGLRQEHSLRDQEELLDALGRVAPDIAAHWPPLRDRETIVAGVEQRCENLSEAWAWIVGGAGLARDHVSSLFSHVRVASIPILIEETADEHNACLRTTSVYRRLPPDAQQALERETVEIYRRLGRPIRSDALAVIVSGRTATDGRR